MIRRPPRSTLDRSSAASDVYKRQLLEAIIQSIYAVDDLKEAYAALVQGMELGFGLSRVHVYRADLGPVSYTHLRAHETVLDLVCRLLLEKKKKHEEAQPR